MRVVAATIPSRPLVIWGGELVFLMRKKYWSAFPEYSKQSRSGLRKRQRFSLVCGQFNSLSEMRADDVSRESKSGNARRCPPFRANGSSPRAYQQIQPPL